MLTSFLSADSCSRDSEGTVFCFTWSRLTVYCNSSIPCWSVACSKARDNKLLPLLFSYWCHALFAILLDQMSSGLHQSMTQIRLEIGAQLDCRNQGVSDQVQTRTSRVTFTGMTAQLRPLTPLFTCKGLPAFGALTAMAKLSSSVAWLETSMQT